MQRHPKPQGQLGSRRGSFGGQRDDERLAGGTPTPGLVESLTSSISYCYLQVQKAPPPAAPQMMGWHAMRRRAGIGSLLLGMTLLGGALGLGGTAAGSSAASDSNATEADRLIGEYGVTDEELADLQAYAAQEDMDLAEVVAKHGWQQAFSDMVAQIRDEHPESFAYSAMNEDGEIGATIAFAGPVPAAVEAQVREFDVPVRTSSDEPYSEQQVVKAVEAAHYTAIKSAGTKDITTEYDHDAEAILVSIGTESRNRHQDGSDPSEAHQEAAELAASRHAEGIRVQINLVDPGVTGNEVIRGGAILRYLGTTSLACTSGWPVDSTSGPNSGLITAEHCDAAMSYSGRNVLTHQRRLTPLSRGDIRFMKSTENVGKAFYYGVGQYRTINKNVGVPSKDQLLCFFGRTTGNHCDEVGKLSNCSGDYCNLVSMKNHDTAPGDSGGPWYYGARPYGVHSGSHIRLLKRRAVFTPLYNTVSHLNVRVRGN